MYGVQWGSKVHSGEWTSSHFVALMTCSMLNLRYLAYLGWKSSITLQNSAGMKYLISCVVQVLNILTRLCGIVTFVLLQSCWQQSWCMCYFVAHLNVQTFSQMDAWIRTWWISDMVLFYWIISKSLQHLLMTPMKYVKSFGMCNPPFRQPRKWWIIEWLFTFIYDINAGVCNLCRKCLKGTPWFTVTWDYEFLNVSFFLKS